MPSPPRFPGTDRVEVFADDGSVWVDDRIAGFVARTRRGFRPYLLATRTPAGSTHFPTFRAALEVVLRNAGVELAELGKGRDDA